MSQHKQDVGTPITETNAAQLYLHVQNVQWNTDIVNRLYPILHIKLLWQWDSDRDSLEILHIFNPTHGGKYLGKYKPAWPILYTKILACNQASQDPSETLEVLEDILE